MTILSEYYKFDNYGYQLFIKTVIVYSKKSIITPASGT